MERLSLVRYITKLDSITQIRMKIIEYHSQESVMMVQKPDKRFYCFNCPYLSIYDTTARNLSLSSFSDFSDCVVDLREGDVYHYMTRDDPRLSES